MTSKIGTWSDLYHSPACMENSLCSGHVFVDYSSIHLLFSQQFHPIYYTTDLNNHLLVEGASQKGIYGSIEINGNVGQQMDKSKSIVDKLEKNLGHCVRKNGNVDF